MSTTPFKIIFPKAILFAGIILAMTISHPVVAQITSDPASLPTVTAVACEDSELKLNGEVHVTISNFKPILDEMLASNKKLILFINDIALEGNYPYTTYPTTVSTSNTVTFFIDHTQQPIDLWNKVTLARKKTELFTTQVSISVGIEGKGPLPTNVRKYPLRIAQKSWFYTCCIVIVFFFLGFVILAVKSSILRSHDIKPTDGGKAPYNLAYVQMAIWFFTIMSSWLMLYVLKHSFNTITDSMVILMGISSATALGAAALGNPQSGATRSSKGFFKDILSDETGATSFHRFQMLAWTGVMVIVFLRQVYSYFSMPEFSSSLMVLMGISSGTYLGFKATENKPSQPPQAS